MQSIMAAERNVVLFLHKVCSLCCLNEGGSYQELPW